jgi:hypothetical protein
MFRFITRAETCRWTKQSKKYTLIKSLSCVWLYIFCIYKKEEFKEEKISRTMTEGWPQIAWYSYVALCYMPLNALQYNITFPLKNTSGSLWLFSKKDIKSLFISTQVVNFEQTEPPEDKLVKFLRSVNCMRFLPCTCFGNKHPVLHENSHSRKRMHFLCTQLMIAGFMKSCQYIWISIQLMPWRNAWRSNCRKWVSHSRQADHSCGTFLQWNSLHII